MICIIFPNHITMAILPPSIIGGPHDSAHELIRLAQGPCCSAELISRPSSLIRSLRPKLLIASVTDLESVVSANRCRAMTPSQPEHARLDTLSSDDMSRSLTGPDIEFDPAYDMADTRLSRCSSHPSPKTRATDCRAEVPLSVPCSSTALPGRTSPQEAARIPPTQPLDRPLREVIVERPCGLHKYEEGMRVTQGVTLVRHPAVDRSSGTTRSPTVARTPRMTRRSVSAPIRRLSATGNDIGAAQCPGTAARPGISLSLCEPMYDTFKTTARAMLTFTASC